MNIDLVTINIKHISQFILIILIFIKLCLVMFSVHCDYVPNMPNAYRNTDYTLHGTFVNFTCHHGYQFPDNSTEKNITCLDNGEWDKPVENFTTCESKKIMIKCRMIKVLSFRHNKTKIIIL